MRVCDLGSALLYVLIAINSTHTDDKTFVEKFQRCDPNERPISRDWNKDNCQSCEWRADAAFLETDKTHAQSPLSNPGNHFPNLWSNASPKNDGLGPFHFTKLETTKVAWATFPPLNNP